VEHILLTISYRTKANTYYPKMFRLVKESSCWEEDNLSLNSNLKDHKVFYRLILAPGPGTYRLPSDFGQYDNIEPLITSFSKGDF